ncbi:hypothetical protein [Roseibium sp. RKSG952]|uniref:hypothetical protein n=1 Tax=Roseibium sp. RKSG952 TaxID=2529384 RepID=UPI0012BBC525|nr:hypothetical protein [Roseibium sp. RKSG952]MTH94800.1 hypothetical protein [Roseibium sp. RKSG952]
MKIKLPLFTVATCIPKGARTEKERVFGEWVSIDIQSPLLEDAPVAVRVYSEDGETEFETRWFDGSHWYETDLTAINLKQIGNPNIEFRIPSKVSGDEQWQKNYEKLQKGEMMPFVSEEMKAISSFNTKETREDLLKRADDLAVIGGKLWQRGGDPVYCIETAYSRPLVVNSEVIEDQYLRPYSFFRVDTDREHVVEFSSIDPGRHERMEELLPHVECLIPESLTLDIESMDFKRHTERAMNSCLATIRNHIESKHKYSPDWRNLPLEETRLITEICMELTAIENKNPEASLETVADIMAELAPLYQNNHTGHYEVLVQLALRYKERPIQMNDDDFNKMHGLTK